MIAGGLSVVIVSYLYVTTSISFYYYALLGAILTFAIGYLLALKGPPQDTPKLAGLVFGLKAPGNTNSPPSV